MPAGRGGGAQQQLGPDPYTMMLFMQMQQNFQLQGELSSLRRSVEEMKFRQLNAELDMLKGMVYGQQARGRGRK